MFVGDQESVGKRQVGGGAGAATFAEPVGDGRSLVSEAIYIHVAVNKGHRCVIIKQCNNVMIMARFV